jgi:hypothetical protein
MVAAANNEESQLNLNTFYRQLPDKKDIQTIGTGTWQRNKHKLYLFDGISRSISTRRGTATGLTSSGEGDFVLILRGDDRKIQN